MDELAHAAGQDALGFRRKLMADHPKALAVLDAVAEKGDWGKKASDGRYRGLSQFRADASYVAALAEISVKDGNKIKVHRIVVAIDPGYAVNPAQIERQIAGSVVFGLSALFQQECTVKNGSIEQENFDSYDSMRIADAESSRSHALRRILGGVGSACLVGAAVAERVLCSHRQAHPLVPTQEPRHPAGVGSCSYPFDIVRRRPLSVP